MNTVNLIAHKDPKSPIAEAYRTLRTNIGFAGVDKKIKTLLITSAAQNEGKSTIAANLALVLAQNGSRVLLMDCDFRNPSQHKLFGLPNKGLSNCIVTNADVNEITQTTEAANLFVLTAGPVAPNPAEILTSKQFETLLAKVKASYDYIVIDTPPVLPVTDACAISSKVDGVLLIVASGENAPEPVKKAHERLTMAGANIIGCVLNKYDVNTHAYGYGYGKGYGYGYGGYYYYYGHEHKETTEAAEAKTEEK